MPPEPDDFTGSEPIEGDASKASVSRIVARPTYPLRPTGIAFMALGTILVVLSMASTLECGLFDVFCVVGLYPVGTILGVALVIAGFPILWYHRPPDPTQVAGQPSELVCPRCGKTNARLSDGFCYECGAPLPPPY